MRNSRRLGILAPVCVIALAAAGQAVAALTPSLWATTSAAGSSAAYSQSASDDPLGALTFYVPAGFTALLVQPEGTAVGTAAAAAVNGDAGSVGISLTGTINAASAATTVSFGGASQAVGTLAAACTGTATHSAFWVINLSGGGQTIQLPAYVDDVPLTNPLSNIANDTVKICFAPPDTAAGTAGRSPSGVRFTGLTIVPDGFSVPPGWYVWHVLATPFNRGLGTLNTAGSVEAQSIDRTPQSVTLKGTPVKGKQGVVALTGKVVAGGKGIDGAVVTVKAGSKTLGKATAGPGGSYRLQVKLARPVTVVATASHAPKPVASCAPAFPPAACAGSTYGAFEVTSSKVRVHA